MPHTWQLKRWTELKLWFCPPFIYAFFLTRFLKIFLHHQRQCPSEIFPDQCQKFFIGYISSQIQHLIFYAILSCTVSCLPESNFSDKTHFRFFSVLHKLSQFSSTTSIFKNDPACRKTGGVMPAGFCFHTPDLFHPARLQDNTDRPHPQNKPDG